MRAHNSSASRATPAKSLLLGRVFTNYLRALFAKGVQADSIAIGEEIAPTERREANRLRSERWRRAHGIMPRRPAQKLWLAEGCSRSTYSTRRCVQDPHREFRPVRAPKMACLHTCGPGWQCDHAGFQEWRWFCPSSTRDQKSPQLCHNASALQGFSCLAA
jgi:hypothetical protein